MRIGDVFRYPKLADAKKQQVTGGAVEPVVDGLPNLLAITVAPDGTLSTLERGINPIAKVSAPDGPRIPAVLISSSPHKVGSDATPWQDHFEPDVGYARYFGDAKPGQKRLPEAVPGNAALLTQFDLHTSQRRSDRIEAAPILLFVAVPHQGRAKGQRKFQGVSLVTGAERIVQWSAKRQVPFTNYRFEFTILDLSAENEEFPWTWINTRREAALTAEDTLKLAPQSWRRWVDEGSDVVPLVRRRVAKLMTSKRADQLPDPDSRSEQILDRIYHHYDGRKHRFEALAELVAERVIKTSGTDYRPGWITPASSDGGADFIGRIDLGGGFARAKLVMLGQAKCVKPSSSINGEQLARVVARLRRGWIGVFVTTGHFSEPAQREVIEDRYPIMMINGRQLADTVWELMHEQGTTDVDEYLMGIDETYDGRIQARLAEEILLDA